MDIKVSYDSSVTASNFSGGAAEEAQFKNAINYVIGLFDQLFTNPISFTIDVGWGEAEGTSIPSYALAVNYANSYTYGKTLTYAQVKQDLKSNSSGSYVQTIAYAHLPSSDPTNGGYFKLTDAEAEALGLTSSNGGVIDQLGFVTNPNGGSWDFDTTTGPGPNQPASNQTDFVAVFEHELTEAMGRVSLAGGSGGVSSPLDLFRYSALGAVDPASVPAGTTNTSYLSFDGGRTSDGIFNNDVKWNGSPYDLGDWTQDPENGNGLGGGTGPQGADAFGTGWSGVLLPFTYDDLEEMNVLGWNLSTDDDVIPEGVTEYANTTLPGPFDVESGGYLDVGAAGTVLFTTLESGAFEDVNGLDSKATIYAGDFQYGDQIGQGQRVDAGGRALYATVDGGEQEIEAGGSASYTTLNGGLQKVFGSATATTIYYGGQQWVVGSDSNSIVEGGGVQNIYAKGTDTGSTIDAGGQQDDNLGGTTHEETVSGQQYVYGSAYSTNVKSGGQQIVETGGVAYNTDIYSGGSVSIYGEAEGLTIYSGGSATVYQGGALQDWKQSAADDFVELVNGALTFDLTGSYVYKGQLRGDGSLKLITTDNSFGGELIVSDAGAFTGAMTIDTGVLEFTSAAAMGSGPIIFGSGFNGTLRIDGAVMPKATIKGFAIGNTIDLAGVAYSSSGAATLESGNLLQVSENGKTYDLQLDPSANYGSDTFDLTADADDGVLISLSKALTTPVWIPPANLSADRTLDILIDESATIANSTSTAKFENVGTYRSVRVTNELSVDNGGLTTTANFTNAYDTAIDIGGFDGGEGGSRVNVAGVLTNDFSLRIGNAGLLRSTLVTAGSLVNAAGGGTTPTGELNLIGSKTVRAELDVDSAAGSGAPGVLSGDFDIEGVALLHFASGQISTIGGELLINGLDAFIATGADRDHNSALEGLSMIGLGADLDSENGASADIDGDLINEGFIYLDNAGDGGEHGDGGGMMSFGGKLTNEDQVYIGNTNLTRSDEITAKGVDNKSSIVITGASSTAKGTLSVTGTFENESSLIIDPFASAHVSGDYQQTGSGTLTLYANTAGDTGALTVTGALSLAGGGAAGGFGSALQVRSFSETVGTVVSVATFAPGQLTGMFGGLFNTGGTYLNLGNGTYGGVEYEDSLGKIVFEVVAAPTTTADAWTAGTSGNWGSANWSNGAPTFYTDATLGAKAKVSLAADMTLDSLTLDAGASLTQQSGHSLSIGQGLAVAAGATLTVDGEMTVGTSGADTLPGSVIVNGWLEVRGIASGGYPTPNGSFTIGSGGTLELDRLDQNNVAFSGARGTLMLEDPGQFEGTISGFESGDRLQVAGDVTSASYNATSHELTFIDNGATINLGFIPASGSSNVQFGLTSGGNSTTITSSVVWDPSIPGEPPTWNYALNWSPAVVPGSSNAVTIGANFTVASDADNSAGQLSLGRGATLTIGDNTTFTVDDALNNSGVIQFAGLGSLILSGSIVNSGEIETGSHVVKNLPPLDFISLEGDVDISGGGKIVLSDPADVFAAHVGPPSTLTLTSAIDGVGEISGMNLDIAGGPGSIIADGSVSDTTVAANQYADTLTIDAAGPITNDNVLGATNSGVLVIKNDVENIGQFATLNADGGTIDIDGITVFGGLLESEGVGGDITADNATLDGSTYGALTNTGPLGLENSGSSLTLAGSIVNDGTMALTAANETLVVDGNVSLGLTSGAFATIGTGVILESESDKVSGQASLTLASGLSGIGAITMAGGITINAGGFLLADDDDSPSAPAGAALTIAKGGTITNSGLLGAFGRPPATLIVEDNVVNVGDGEIAAESSVPGANVVISNVTITSGTIATNPYGSIEADNSTLNGVDIEGTVNLGTAGASLTLEGAIGLNTDDNILNGTINFNAKSQTLVINGSVSVSGPGEINLIDADDLVESKGTFTKVANSPSSLTLDSEIAGEGTIGDAQLTLSVGQQGQIVAKGPNALILNTGAKTIANAGTLESDGGELVIDSNVKSAGGTIAADSEDVEISGVTISGGAFAGHIFVAATLLETGSVLDGSSQGALTNDGALQIDKTQSTVTLEGAIDNAGIISFNSQTQSLLVASAVTLSGGGLIFMNDSTDKILSNGHAATLSSSNQITGVGVIGDADTTLTVSSGGSIIADPSHDLTPTSGDTLTITTGANAIINQGALEAQNGGVLKISNDINNASGAVEANGALSIVALNGVAVAGGTLSTSASGVIEADDNLTLDGASRGAMTDNATVDLETKSATLTLTGVIANAGTLDLAAQKQKVILSGNLTLTGAGSVLLGDSGDTLVDNGSATTLTIDNTVAGVGAIGDSKLTLTISQGGAIVATPAYDVTTVSGNKLTIGALAAGIVNDGELSAADGGTLVVKDAVTGSGDAIISGGRLELADAFSQQIQFTTGDVGALQIDDVTAFGSDILGFTTDDTINLSKVAYDAKGSVTLEAGNVLQVVENGTTYDFHLDPSQNFGGDKFVLSKDTTTGSDITVEAIPIVMQYIVPQKTDAINPEVGKLGDLVVGLDAQTTNAMVGGGGELKVESGGVAMGGSIVDSGVEYVEAGGSAEGAELGDPGLQVVYAGGSSTDTTISGGEQEIYGSAYSSDVQSGGLQVVEAKGTSYDSEVDTGGEQDVDGGADQGLYVDGGLVKVNDGGALKATTAINVGTVLLNDAALSGNFYFGASSGVVEVAAGAKIAGEIALAGDDATLRIDGGVLPTNEITGFGVGEGVLGLGEDAANNDVIDLANVAYDANWSAALGPNNVLEIEEGGKIYDLNLDPTLSYVGFGFALAADSAGTGTAITVGVADAWTNSAGGDWATSANWSEGTPTSNASLTSDAVFALPKVKATIAAGESETVGSLALDANDAVLNVAGKLTVNLALSVADGATLDLAAGGVLTLTGLTTLASGTASGSPRDALTINGALTIGGFIANSSTVLEAGAGAATLGASSGLAVTLTNTSQGTWNIANDNGVALGAASAATFSNAGLLEKSAGAGVSVIAASLSDSGTLTAATGTLELTGASNTIAGALMGAGAIEFAGESTTLVTGASASVAHLAEAGAGASLRLATNLTYAGVFTQGAGATLTVSTGNTLTLMGTTSLTGTTSGLGTLDLSGGGSTSIDSGAKISVSAWSLLGSKTSATLDENLAYAGTFGEAAGDTLDLSDGYLLLTGSDTFSGGTVDGSNRLYAEGTTQITDGLTIGGTAWLENTKTLTQSGGPVTVGDNAGNTALLYNTSTGTYAIADDSGISRGSSTASYIVNAGLFEKTGGAGTSAIAPALTNNGTVLVSSGVLDVEGAVSGTGADTISGASTLEFGSTVASGQTTGFTGAGGMFDLGDPKGFSGKISGFDTVGSKDQLEIAAPWTYLGFSENAADTQGTLNFANGAIHVSLTLLGDYTAANFVHQAGPGGSTLVTYA